MTIPSKASRVARVSYVVFNTAFGWCAVVGLDKMILRVVIGYRSRRALYNFLQREFGEGSFITPLLRRVVNKIVRYCSGEKVYFKEVLDWSSLTSFQQKVLKEVKRIPYGGIETYGSIACRIGYPSGARAVGRVLAMNPFPLLIPCHRVVRKDGSLGGFSTPGGMLLKRKLLRLEGS